MYVEAIVEFDSMFVIENKFTLLGPCLSPKETSLPPLLNVQITLLLKVAFQPPAAPKIIPSSSETSNGNTIMCYILLE